MNVYLAKFMIYYEIHRMHREGHSITHISNYLVLNRRTVKKYLCMSEEEYEAFLIRQSDRKKILLPYEEFVKKRLKKHQDTTAAQMHDWLKEHHPDFPRVSQKTVFNFVHWVRDKHRLPVVKTERQYQMVEELPYGKQAQVDFGQYNMRTTTGRRKKVFFFTMVLSRSRYKYVWFTESYFTSQLAIGAHEQGFEYFGGVTDEIVYDQDKVFMVSENGGDIILTEAFRAYTRAQSFDLYFCRKADPESKGKVENVVKYVKQNFLYNRTFHNIDMLNEEVMGWLGRTANLLPHATTRKEPHSEWVIEQSFLKPYKIYTANATTTPKYSVRKNNTISYKGNYYSLPLGTYQGKGTMVAVRQEKARLIILDPETNQEICQHEVATGKGQKIANTDHKRDKSAAIQEMIEEVCGLFAENEKARQWLHTIKKAKPRYIRDQLLIIKEALSRASSGEVNQALDYCVVNNISSASDFKSILACQKEPPKKEENLVQLNPLNGKVPDNAHVQPEKSSLKDYQSILKKS